MRQMGWKKVAALSEEDHKYADYITAVQDLVEKDGLSFVANRNIPNDAKLPLAQVIRFPPPPPHTVANFWSLLLLLSYY